MTFAPENRGHPAGRSRSAALLRGLAARLVAPEDAPSLVVRRRSGRRPLVAAAGRRLYASVSRSGTGTAVAVGAHPIGIDIERLRRVREVDAVAHRLATVESAWHAIEDCRWRGGCPDRPRDAHAGVVWRWTRYEAVVKALGVGMALPPGALTIGSDGRVGIRTGRVPLTVSTRFVAAVPGDAPTHVLSVATRLGVPVTGIDDLCGSPWPRDSPDPAATGAPAVGSDFLHPLRKGTAVHSSVDKQILRELIAETIEVMPEDITDDTNFMEELGVDSLMALEMMVVLEKKFGVKLDESYLTEITSLDSVHALLESKLASTTDTQITT